MRLESLNVHLSEERQPNSGLEQSGLLDVSDDIQHSQSVRPCIASQCLQIVSGAYNEAALDGLIYSPALLKRCPPLNFMIV